MTPKKTLDTLPTAFVFDVFGTVYDWRTTVSSRISQVLLQKLGSLDGIEAYPSSVSFPDGSKPDLSTTDAVDRFSKSFAQEWRDSYKGFVGSNGGINNDDDNVGDKEAESDSYTTVDTHHLHSLRSLLEKYSLAHLFTFTETHELSKIWHSLKPWDDSGPGISGLKKLGIVSTLSNGNVRLLVDLQRNSGVAFDLLLSGQVWRAFKPEERVYVGACEILGIGGGEEWRVYCEGGGRDGNVGEGEWRRKERGRVAMVAAHIGDLRAAKACGLTTIYIERPQEDDDRDAGERYLRDGEDWVDMWVRHDEGGILEVARRLGELKKD
ncbi:hypothetical protein TWF718_004487 [Orbilia javanica]|uniref:Haloacid dehalogenase n=1 Tax=Orbilia javanica TaxID=47235 RepID=A0AAN8RL15_9PEZI